MTSELAAEREFTPEPLVRAPSRVAVLDAGGQYVDMIQKAVERLGYPADVLPLATPVEEIEGMYGAVVLSGSPANSQLEGAPMPDQRIWDSQIPKMGICYGLHCAVTAYGGLVEPGETRQDGIVKTKVHNKTLLFQGIKDEQPALFTHGNFVTEVPPSFDVIGWHNLEDGTEVVTAVEGPNNYVGVQFHPEVFDDTPEGYSIFKNFFNEIAQLEPDDEFHERKVNERISAKRAEIRSMVGDRPVIAFISGGVDSAVALALAATEIEADNLHAFYIKSFVMRDEDDMVIEMLESSGLNVNIIDASDYFLRTTIERDGKVYGPLIDTTDPKIQRNIVGKGFIDVMDKITDELGLDNPILLQGTNAADRIESGISKGDNNTEAIVDHHNQVKEALEKDRLEPLDDLYKDEIREMGRTLGLQRDITERHPFPGPGLVLRVIDTGGEFNHRRGLQTEINSYIRQHQVVTANRATTAPIECRVLPIRTAGVAGDERSYHSVVAINQFMSWRNMAEVAHSIPKKFRDDINRVVISLGDRPINDFTVTETKLSEESFAQLRHADRIVFDEIRRYRLMESIQQCPVILLPLSYGNPGGRSIVLRPVMTSNFMTVRDMIPGQDIPPHFLIDVTERLLTEVPGLTQVFLDQTPKPPGRTEWK